MDITFVNPGVDYMIRSIMLFQTEGEAENRCTISIRSLIGYTLQACRLQKEKTISSAR